MKLTARQQEAQAILGGPATHVLFEGGSRSGKTFLLTRAVCVRAMKAPGSRHGIFRFALNHIKASIVADTFPKVMRECWPRVPYALNKGDLFATLHGGSEIWFGGLDDKERTEKVLGLEFATIYLNEVSQIPYSSRDIVLSRLAQKAEQVVDGVRSPLPLRMYYDLNPTNRNHWAYRLFHEARDPETKMPVANPQDYAWFRLNPQDNAENLSADYLRTLAGMSQIRQRRFLRGEWTEANPSALFTQESIDRYRVMDGAVPQTVRIVVAVDPSGADDADNADQDAIGIVVAGVGTDGNAYILEDCTVKAGPATWGAVATSAFDRHKADRVVGEVNYGGAMVRHTIQTARARTPFVMVTATRGKAVRAEPVSALYEQGKVRHVGIFPELEDELCAFSTFGYTGSGSPNRADAAIWALTDLFPGVVNPKPTAVKLAPPQPAYSPFRAPAGRR